MSAEREGQREVGGVTRRVLCTWQPHAGLSVKQPWLAPSVSSDCYMHITAARLGCKRVMAGNKLANSCPSYMNRCKKCYVFSSLGGGGGGGGSFLAQKAACMGSERVYAN